MTKVQVVNVITTFLFYLISDDWNHELFENIQRVGQQDNPLKGRPSFFATPFKELEQIGNRLENKEIKICKKC